MADDRFDLFHLLEAGRPPVTSPEESTPVNMRACQLMPYQRRCLAWMMAVESGYAALVNHPMREWTYVLIDILMDGLIGVSDCWELRLVHNYTPPGDSWCSRAGISYRFMCTNLA